MLPGIYRVVHEVARKGADAPAGRTKKGTTRIARRARTPALPGAESTAKYGGREGSKAIAPMSNQRCHNGGAKAGDTKGIAASTRLQPKSKHKMGERDEESRRDELVGERGEREQSEGNSICPQSCLGGRSVHGEQHERKGEGVSIQVPGKS